MSFFNNKLLVFFGIIIFLFLLASFLFIQNKDKKTNISSSNFDTDYVIENNLNNANYGINQNFANVILDDLSFPLEKYIIRISDDSTTSTFHQYKNQDKVSGVSVNSLAKTGEINIFINPDLLTEEELLYEINNQFLNGLFFLDLELTTPEENSIDYALASNDANDVFMRLYDKQKMPIERK